MKKDDNSDLILSEVIAKVLANEIENSIAENEETESSVDKDANSRQSAIPVMRKYNEELEETYNLSKSLKELNEKSNQNPSQKISERGSKRKKEKNIRETPLYKESVTNLNEFYKNRNLTNDRDIKALNKEISLFKVNIESLNRFLGKYSTLSESGFGTIAEKEMKKFFTYKEGDDGELIKTPSRIVKNFENAKTNVERLREDVINTENPERQAEKILLLAEATEEYEKTLKELKETYEGSNATLEKALKSELKREKDIYEKDPANRSLYDAKYAFIRDGRDQALFKTFQTTGNWGDSFRKTAFNRSAGLRQTQGFVGFAANLGFNKSGTLLSIGLGTFAKALKTAGKAVLDFAKYSVQAYGEIQSIKTNLGVVYGSQAEADATFNEIAQYSVKSPFGVQTVSEYAVLLKQSGIYASDLMDTLKQIGDVAGGNQEKFANVANAFAQIEANGKANTRQLRQFATAGIPIYKELSKELGVSVERIRKMTEEGKITSDVIEDVFKNMTSAGGVFEGAVEKGAKTLKARKMNLQDAKQLAGNALGEYIINWGGTGKGDSVAHTVLGLQESIYNGLQSWLDGVNLAKNVERIADAKPEIERLKELYNITSDKETKKLLAEQIKVLEGYFGADQERADAYASFIARTQKFSGKEIFYGSEKEKKDYTQNLNDKIDTLLLRQKDLESKRFQANALLSNGSVNPKYAEIVQSKIKTYDEELLKVERDLAVTMAKMNNIVSSEEILGSLSKLKEKDGKGFSEEDNYQLNRAIEQLYSSNLSKAFESVEEGADKNSQSFYKKYQEGLQHDQNTEKGQKEQLLKEKKAWEDLRALQKEYTKHFKEVEIGSENIAKLSLDTAISLKDMEKIFTSGIIKPVEKISMNREDITIDDHTVNLLSGREQREEISTRTNDWQFAYDNLKQLTQSLEKYAKENNDNMSHFYSEILSDFLDKLTKDGQAITLDAAGYATYEKALKDLTGVLELRKGQKMISNEDMESFMNVFGMQFVKGNLTPDMGEWRNPSKKEVDPLWRRILSSSFGLDISLLREKNISGRDAVGLWDKKTQHELVNNIGKAMLTTGSSWKDISKELVYKKDASGNVVTNSYDGTAMINWEKTAKSFKKFALNLDSATDITHSYVGQLTSEIDTLENFLLSGITTQEEGSNIKDTAYAEFLGQFADSLEALDANAFSSIFTKTSDGLIILREGAIDAANALLEVKKSESALAGLIASSKQIVQDEKDKVDEAKQQALIYNYASNSPGYATMTPTQQDNYKKSLEEYFAGNEAISNFATLSGSSSSKILEALLTGSFNVKDYSSLKETGKSDENIIKLNNEIAKLNNKAAALKERISTTTNTSELPSLQTELDATEALLAKKVDELKRETELASDLTEKNTTLAEAAANVQIAFNNATEAVKENERLLMGINLNTAVQNLGGNPSPYNFYYRQPEELKAKGYEAPDMSNLKQFLRGFIPGVEDIQIHGTNSYSDQVAINRFSEITGQDLTGLTFTDVTLMLNPDSLQAIYNSGAKYLSEQDQESFKTAIEKKRKGSFSSPEEEAANNNVLADLTSEVVNLETAFQLIEDKAISLRDTMKETFKSGLIDGFNNSMMRVGEHLYKMNDASKTGVELLEEEAEYGKDMENIWKNVVQGMLAAIGPAMTEAGFALVTAGAKRIADKQYGSGIALVGAGLTLAAAGGLASISAGMLGASMEDDTDTDDDDKAREDRLNNLKELLSSLIDQARTDAEYYQKNLLHAYALSENQRISTRSVNDAIISPSGDIITTHPDDYLIATKTPEKLVGSNKNVTNISIEIVNESGSTVKVKDVKQENNSDGSVKIKAMIVAITGQAISDGELDGAFASRDRRINGYSVAG